MDGYLVEELSAELSRRDAMADAPRSVRGLGWLPKQGSGIEVDREADALVASDDGVKLATLDLGSGTLSVDLGAIVRLEQLLQVSHALVGHPQAIAARGRWGIQTVGRLGLVDRNAFLATLRRRLTGEAASTTAKGAIAHVDVDYLKYINDRMGHRAGDLVLEAVAERLQQVAGDPVVARIGGDEFMLLFDDCTPHEAAQLVAGASCDALGPVMTDIGAVPVTFSAGVTDLAGGVDEVLSRVDATLFQAKRAGRDQIRVFGDGAAAFVGERRDVFGTIEALMAKIKEAEIQARTDALTGLANRRALDERFALDDAIRARSGRVDWLLFVDLDRFHSFNHARGQEAGDEALRTVATLVRTTLRDGDACFRRGGEEFVVVLPDSGHDAACAVAERLRAAVEAAGIPHAGHPDCPTLTTTVVVGEVAPTARASAVVELGARAAFGAKEAGARNRVIILTRDHE